MTTAGSDPASELQAIERAREGDHDAFVRLYRQDAPPAWRLGLALTADPVRAASAVGQAFARVLAPARLNAPRSEVPFRLRLLTATRHVVLDEGTGAPRPEVDAGAEADPDRSRGTRALEVMHAFHQLPERWRTVLWLASVEGLELADAARVLGVPPDGAADLAERAEAGLRTQWQRDRLAAGEELTAAPEQMARLLQSVLPLPLELFDEVEARWRAQRERRQGPVGMLLPGGRPVPRWAERGLLVSTAALIAAGLTSALVLDRDPDVRRIREGQLAGPTRSATLGSTPPPEPRAYLDGEPDDAADAAPLFAAARAVARVDAVGKVLDRATGAPPAAAPAGPASPKPPSPPPPAATAEPRLQITVGIGPALALSLGDQCTGVQVAGEAIGCEPDPDTGVTVEGSALP